MPPDAGANVAVTARDSLIVTVQFAIEPLQAPLQAENCWPAGAAAVSTTTVFCSNVALQVAPQSMPSGCEVTRPRSVGAGVVGPITVTTSSWSVMPSTEPSPPPQAAKVATNTTAAHRIKELFISAVSISRNAAAAFARPSIEKMLGARDRYAHSPLGQARGTLGD